MKKILPISALFLLPSLVFACSCIYGTSFCEHVKSSSKVANVRIINAYMAPAQLSEALWIDVVVVEEILGTVGTDTMTILASYGTSCDPDYSAFQIGGSLIVQVGEALSFGPTGWYKFEFHNACNQAFLWLENDTVSGFTKDNYERLAYDDFKNSIGTCANYTHTFEKEELAQYINISPVPASEQATIYLGRQFDYDYTLYAVTGQAVLREQVSGEYHHPIPVSDLPNGLYFLRFQVGEVTVAKRLVVQH